MAVVTIVEEEFAAVRSAGGFDGEVDGTPYLYRRRLAQDGFDVVLARAVDRCNAPCAELVSDLAEALRPEFIVLCGIAGGIRGRDDVGLGDVVVADHVDWYEMRKLVQGTDVARKQCIDPPSALMRSMFLRRVLNRGSWSDAVDAERPEEGAPKAVEGNLIAGDKILGDGDNSYQKKILDEFEKALAVDMESYGLARSVYRARGTRHYNLNYLVVRGISDLVDDPENDDARRRWRPYAAATAAAFTMAIVDEVVEECKE